MNYLAIDYGSKNVGFAYSINGIISTLPVAVNNDQLLNLIKQLIINHSIDKIFVGLSEGAFADLTLKFVSRLRLVVDLEVDTIEESVSTIEATEVYKSNFGKRKNYKQSIDSIAAAVILRRVITN